MKSTSPATSSSNQCNKTDLNPDVASYDKENNLYLVNKLNGEKETHEISFSNGYLKSTTRLSKDNLRLMCNSSTFLKIKNKSRSSLKTLPNIDRKLLNQHQTQTLNLITNHQSVHCDAQFQRSHNGLGNIPKSQIDSSPLQYKNQTSKQSYIHPYQSYKSSTNPFQCQYPSSSEVLLASKAVQYENNFKSEYNNSQILINLIRTNLQSITVQVDLLQKQLPRITSQDQFISQSSQNQKNKKTIHLTSLSNIPQQSELFIKPQIQKKITPSDAIKKLRKLLRLLKIVQKFSLNKNYIENQQSSFPIEDKMHIPKKRPFINISIDKDIQGKVRQKLLMQKEISPQIKQNQIQFNGLKSDSKGFKVFTSSQFRLFGVEEQDQTIHKENSVPKSKSAGLDNYQNQIRKDKNTDFSQNNLLKIHSQLVGSQGYNNNSLNSQRKIVQISCQPNHMIKSSIMSSQTFHEKFKIKPQQSNNLMHSIKRQLFCTSNDCQLQSSKDPSLLATSSSQNNQEPQFQTNGPIKKKLVNSIKETEGQLKGFGQPRKTISFAIKCLNLSLHAVNLLHFSVPIDSMKEKEISSLRNTKEKENHFNHSRNKKIRNGNQKQNSPGTILKRYNSWKKSNQLIIADLNQQPKQKQQNHLWIEKPHHFKTYYKEICQNKQLKTNESKQLQHHQLRNTLLQIKDELKRLNELNNNKLQGRLQECISSNRKRELLISEFYQKEQNVMEKLEEIYKRLKEVFRNEENQFKSPNASYIF